jgi:hypothetical protein
LLAPANRVQDEQYANALANYGSGGGGGGGGMSRKQRKQIESLYQKYFDLSQAQLTPYIEAGKRMLPQQEALYKQGMSGLGDIATKVLSPESLAITNSSIPAYKIPLVLPKSLKGGQ